jgi:hypothetical protein
VGATKRCVCYSACHVLRLLYHLVHKHTHGSHSINTEHEGGVRGGIYRPLNRVALTTDQLQLCGLRQKQLEGWSQLVAICKQSFPAEHIQAETGSTKSDHQTTYVTEMTYRFCSHQGQQNIVILLTLIFVD